MLRTARAWSQERLAEEAGMHRTYMWGIEQGARNREAADPRVEDAEGRRVHGNGRLIPMPRGTA